MATQYIRRGATAAPGNTSRVNSNYIYVDSDTDTIKFSTGTSGTTEKELANMIQPFNTYVADGAVSIATQVAYLTKGSAGAYTVAAPGAAGIGVRITLTTGTDFAHVTTFTGTTLQDGTAGANTTWTSAAVQGSSLTIVGVTATKWNVESFNLGTIAP